MSIKKPQFLMFASILCFLFSSVTTVQAADSLEFWMLSAYTGKTGDSITVTGKGFENGNTFVYFGNQKITPTTINESHLSFLIPALSLDKTYAVKLVRDSQQTSTQDFYITLSSSTPEFWRLNTYVAKPGDQITAYGKNLPDSVCAIVRGPSDQGVRSDTISRTNNSLIFSLPLDIASDTTYSVRLANCTRGGTPWESQKQSIYVQSPSTDFELWRLSQYSAKPGDKIKITGRGFDNYNTTVVIAEKGVEHYGGTYLQIDKRDYTLKGSTEITITIPDYSQKLKPNTTYEVSLYWGGGNAGGSIRSQDLYITQNENSSLELWQLSDYSVFPGKTIEITGSNLDAKGLFVKIGDTRVEPKDASEYKLSVTIPEDIKPGRAYPVSLRVGDIKSDSQDIYIKDPRYEK